MIDVPKLRRAIDDTPGDSLRVTKAQLRELLDEVLMGQAARRTLRLGQAVATVLPA